MINLWIEMNPRLSLTRIRRAEHYFESPTVADLDRGSYTKGSPQIRIGRNSEDNTFLWRKNSETDL